MGREDEVRDLFDDNYDQVVRTAFLIVQDWGRAEEVAQDAFVQLLRYWGRVSGHEMPAAWVRRVAVRLAVRLGAESVHDLHHRLGHGIVTPGGGVLHGDPEPQPAVTTPCSSS